jgi:RadC-like JAB domain
MPDLTPPTIPVAVVGKETIVAVVPCAEETVPVLHEDAAPVDIRPADMVPAKSVPWMKLERNPSQYAAVLEQGRALGKITDPKKVYEIVADALSREDQEVFLVVLCDVKFNSRGVVEVARGQRSKVSVAVIDVFRPVLESGAEGFIVVHNHPSGSASPSEKDKVLTAHLQKATKLIGSEVSFLDHVIVGMSEYYSFDKGKLFKVRTPKAIAKARSKA